MTSLSTRIRELEAFREEFLSGGFPQRSALGPGAISSQFLRSKSITSNMLDVSELSAVAANTGALTVSGALVAGSGANTMGYDPATGLYIGGATIGASPFGVTPAGAMTATGVTVTGSVTASTLSANGTGSIAGWTIDSTKLSQGNTGIGASGVYRMWSGNLGTPASSNFSVDSSGNIKSAGGTIAGMTVDSSKMVVGNVGVGSSGGYSFWAGNSTPSSAQFRVDASGNMTASLATITGAVTASSGSFTGSVTTSNLDANAGEIGGLDVDGTLTVTTSGKIQSGKTTYGSGTGWLIEYNSGTPRLDIGSSSAYLRWDGSALTMKGRMEFGTNSYIESDAIVVSASASSSLTFKNTTTSYLEMGALSATAYITAVNSADLIIGSSGGFVTIGAAESVAINMGDFGGTYSVLLRDSAGVNQWSVNSDGLVNFATAPTASPGNCAWTSRNFSADAGGYFKVQIGGTTYRIPTYADS